MLITRHFALVHVPKTGGSFIADLCRRHLPPDWHVESSLGPHAPWDRIADTHGDLPAISFVRNPWDWYVSWYHSMVQNPPDEPHTIERRPVWVGLFGRGDYDFKRTVTNACTGENFHNRPLAEVMHERGIDLYSAFHQRIAGRGIDAGRVEVGRFERLREDFLSFLQRHDVPVPDGMVREIKDAPPYNASRRGPYRDYYDDELRELVRSRARSIVDVYGYEF